MRITSILQVPGPMAGLLSGTTAWILSIIHSHSYIGIALLMTLEGASLPVPSEVVIPVAGFLAAKGILTLPLAFLAVLVGNTIGIAIDYAVGYYLGKEKMLKIFHIRKQSMAGFDAWFKRNGAFAVFISRFVPEVRGLMSFPAGFARMPLKKFFFWSIAGSAIWDVALLLFGYYLISIANLTILFSVIAVFAILLYVIYRVAKDKISSKRKRR